MTTVTHQHASPGRLPELALSIIGVGLGLMVYVMACGEVPETFTRTAAVFAGAAFVGHLLLRFAAPYADPVLYPTVLVLNGIGLSVIHRLDSDGAARQSLYALLGLVLCIVILFALQDHRTLRRFTYTSLIAGIVLLLLPLVPGLGREINGSRIWIGLGGFNFQPAELAKIMLSIFFAGYLVVNRDNLALAGRKILGLQLPRLRHFAPLMLAWLACLAVLISQKDLGTSLLFFGLFVSMLYVATDRLSWMIIGSVLAAAGGTAVVKLFPHVMARFHVWLHAMDPEVYEAPHGSYQVVQAHFGMASGGLLGTGLGEGNPGGVPQADSDFIISSIGEELGMATVFAILCLYLVLVIRGLRTASYVRDGFGKLLAAGLSFTIALQVFVVVGGVTRLIPLTGLTLPFLARGGSSLLCNWIVLALLLRISNAARRPHGATAEPLPPAWEALDDGVATDKEDEPAKDLPGADVPSWRGVKNRLEDAPASASDPDGATEVTAPRRDDDDRPTEAVRIR